MLIGLHIADNKWREHMRASGQVLLAILISGQASLAIDCSGPTSFCAMLNPDLVVFIGKQVSVSGDPRGPTITFEVLEMLWGPTNARTIAVKFGDVYTGSGKVQFLAVFRGRDGLYGPGDCGSGFMLPADDARAREFRQYLKERKPARGLFEVWSSPGYVPIPGVRVRLEGNGRVLKGITGPDGSTDLGLTPPGEYSVTTAKKHFAPSADQDHISILPGSCARFRILITSDSVLSGRIVYHDGQPLQKARLHAMGRVRSGSLERLFMESTYTDENGRFLFQGLVPGGYYLFTNLRSVDETSQPAIPKTYYPGVQHWREATRLVIKKGSSIENLLFRLSDFGPKRNVELKVLSEDGLPVPGATVTQAQLDDHNSWTPELQKASDANGRASFEAWTIASYRFAAELWVAGKPHYSGAIEIPPVQATHHYVLRLKGLRLRTQ